MASIRDFHSTAADMPPAEVILNSRVMEESFYILASDTGVEEAADRSTAKPMTVSERDRYIMLSSLF